MSTASPIDRNLDHLFSPFRTLVKVLVNQAKMAGMDVDVFEGYRSMERQAILLSLGRALPWEIGSSTIPRVTRAFPGEGLHSYGLAVDIVFNASKNFQDGWNQSHPWGALGLLGQHIGLTWGGDFKMKDYPHFEYPFVPKAMDLKELYKDGGLVKVWDALATCI